MTKKGEFIHRYYRENFVYDIPNEKMVVGHKSKNFEHAYRAVNTTQVILKAEAGFGQDAEVHNLGLLASAVGHY